MIKLSRLFFVSTALSLFVIQSSSSISYSQSSSSNFDRKSGVTKPEKSTESIAPATAPEKNPGVITDPLVRVLISKGVLNDEEGRSISISGTPSEQRNRLAVLLRLAMRGGSVRAAQEAIYSRVMCNTSLIRS